MDLLIRMKDGGIWNEKNVHFGTLVVLTILFLFSITACQSEKTDNLSAKRTEFEKMDIAMPQVMVQCFAFSEAGDVYVLDWDGVLTRVCIRRNGKEKC